MPLYELIVETRQPGCGGKPPKVYQFTEVETDDPAAYVARKEPGLEQELIPGEGGEILVSVSKDMHQVVYRFTPI